MPERSRALTFALALLLLGVSFSAAKLVQQDALSERQLWPKVEEYKVLPPPSSAPIVYAWLGRQLGADITWARMLVYYGSSIVGESDFRYLEKFIDNVIALDPKFRRLYEWAGYAVAWRKEKATVAEFRASIKYLERAIVEFPDDWKTRQQLALRYALDLNPQSDTERRRYRARAATLLEEAALLPGANIQLGTMAVSLRTRMGQRDRALADLRGLLMATDNPEAQKHLLERYRSVLDDPELKDETASFRAEFDKGWKETMPYAPADFYVLLGPKPSPRVDLETIAPVRNLLIVDLLDDQQQARPDDARTTKPAPDAQTPKPQQPTSPPAN